MPVVASSIRTDIFDTVGVKLPEGWEFRFLDDLREDGLISGCQGADFLLLEAIRPPLTERVIDHIPSIRLIQTDGAGFDHIDVKAAAARGIPVANAPGQNVFSVAEYVLGLIIMMQRRVHRIDRLVKAGSYAAVRIEAIKQGLPELRGSSLGLIGLGRIGLEVARLAKAFGARLSYYNIPRVDSATEEELGITYREVDELLANSQIVSLHVPLTEKTRGLIGARELALLPRGALIINTARGEVVDQEALADALVTGRVGGAAVDTIWPEPPLPDHPLLCLPPDVLDRVIHTAHTAGTTSGAIYRMQQVAIDNMVRTWKGNIPEHIVNEIVDLRPLEINNRCKSVE